MKARIDAPLATVDRLDQNAKQLLALATTLQALLVTVIKLAAISNRYLLAFGIFAFVFLFLSIAFSARAILEQVTYIGVTSIIDLLNGPRDRAMVPVLGEQLELMCKSVDYTLRQKRKLLGMGMGFFTVSLFGSLGCLVFVLLNGRVPS